MYIEWERHYIVNISLILISSAIHFEVDTEVIESKINTFYDCFTRKMIQRVHYPLKAFPGIHVLFRLGWYFCCI